MKIVDLSTGVAGQWAAKLMAMGGADVFRPEGGQRPRELATYLDAFKKIVPGSGHELLTDADVVFTTFDRGRLIGPADGIDIPKNCVHVITSTFGTTGPYAAYRGGPMAAWAAGGYLAITGKPDREPIIGPEHICEYICGYTAAIATEAALYRRRRTGEGATVDVNSMEAMLCVHQTTFPQLAIGDVRRRNGRYYEVYPLVTRPCRDGYVKLSVVTDEEYDRFLIAIDRPDLAADERFNDRFRRYAYRDEFDAEIAPFLESRDGEDIVEILHSYGVTAAKVATTDDVRANPQLAFRNYWQPGKIPGTPIPPIKSFAKAGRPLSHSPLARVRSPELPLSGLVVADFTVFWAGPLASRLMADLGARTIWVERPGSRALWPNWGSSSVNSGDFYNLDLSRNKESIVLDLASKEGLEAAKTLVANADLLIENNRPGVMDKLGLGPATVCAEHPQIVYVSLSGYGSQGPWSQRRSYGPAIEAASGIEGRTGYLDDEPLRLGHALPDATGGLSGALAALRGLREREEQGVGGWFDVAQLETYAAMSGEDYVAGEKLARIGNQSRWGVRQGVYPCAGNDDWIAIRLVGDRDLGLFADATGVDPSDESAIAAFTSTHEKNALADKLQAAGIEAFPALKPDEFPDNAHLRKRGYLLDVTVGAKTAVLAGSPLRPLTDPSGPSPNFGEHSSAILGELARLQG